MSTDPDPECGKCGKPSVRERPSPDAESDGDGSQAAAASTTPSPSCRCAKEDGAAASGKRDSTDDVLMDIDNDLTTNERMPTVDELEQPKPKPKPKPVEVAKKEKEEKLVEPAEQKSLAKEQPTKAPPSPPDIKIEEEEEEKPSENSSKEKQQKLQEQQLQSQEDMPPSSPEAPPNPSQRVGKITRSSLNGTANQSAATRTPAILKRLRKSTRFKAKPTGSKGNAAAGNSSQANGHNNGPNNGVSGSSTHLAGAGAHPSNTNKHGKSGTGGPGGSPAARSRRTLFKRPAQKTPKVQACTKFVKSVFYKGSYMQIGDIVSIVDGEQNLYYAQIRGLLVDAYCEKSAFLTWLIPTQDSPDPQEGFDPATYLIGPDEELSRKLCYLEFVMHAPSNYYFDRSTPFPLPDVDEYTAQRSGGYIWTRLPVVKREKGDRERERERETRGRDTGHKASGAS